MTESAATDPQPSAELTTYLFARRDAIFNQWRSTCEADPSLSKVRALSREEFNNLLPLILDSLEERILSRATTSQPATLAQAHGLHRWHKAHSLIDTLHELNHLAQILHGELQAFVPLFPQLDRGWLLNSQQHITRIMQETVEGSVAKYDELQRLQATNRGNTLQRALEHMQELSQQRGEVLRESTHDLRGGFGLIHSAAYLLKDPTLSEGERHQFIDILSRNLTSIKGMLTNLMDLSRLEAGQETLQSETVDVAQLLQEMVASAQPLAAERGIVLQANGPQSLLVDTDRVKLQRIVQNLLLNALKYTTATAERLAVVAVSWSTEGAYRWGFSIQDSGPGLPTTTVGILSQQLKPTVEPTSVLGPDQSEPVAVVPDQVPQIPTPEALEMGAGSATGGEGVGLQIVKRLCELLDANLDVESQAGRGTLFRIRMPQRQAV